MDLGKLDLSQLLQMGSAGAVIYVVWLFLQYLSKRDTELASILAELRAVVERAISTFEDKGK